MKNTLLLIALISFALNLKAQTKAKTDTVKSKTSYPATNVTNKLSDPDDVSIPDNSLPIDTTKGNGYMAVEIQASFAGPGTIFDFIGNNIRYPVNAYKNHIQGKVLVKFTVATNGQVINEKVLQPVSAELDTEALRVVGLSHWHPAIQNGRAVPVNFTIPITFDITSPASKPGVN